MKVRVTLTVDIDPEAWSLDYGITKPSELREDVTRYTENLIFGQMEATGMLMKD